MTILCLRYHQYKFIVDGVWRHDERAPSVLDPNGNVNNWVFVRKPELTAGEFDRNDLLQQRYLLQELQNQIAEQLFARAAASEDVPMSDDTLLITDRKEPVPHNCTLWTFNGCLGVYTASDS